MEKRILLAKPWADGATFDVALMAEPAILTGGADRIIIDVAHGTALKIGCTLRILSFTNQLASLGREVAINFVEGQTGAMGYLSRMGFFELLSPDVEILPGSPTVPRFRLFKGKNRGLVEIAALSPQALDEKLPSRLSAAVAAFFPKGDREELEVAVFTVFSELIQNVKEHSQTPIDGYAAMQKYGGRTPTVEVVVSDSGLGILETLRPALVNLKHPYGRLGDSELLFKAITEGVSRNGPGYGCGLNAAAMHALRYGATLDIRLPSCNVQFVPADGQYRPSPQVYGTDKMPYFPGTHICFDFRIP